MSCDFGGNDSLLGIFYIWKSQMFGWCYITKECSTIHGSNGATDGCGDMVISGSNIGDKWSEYIERSSHTDALLDFHIGSYLIQRHMSGTFHHNLYIVIPCTFCQFSETDQFFNLAYIGCICQTSRSAGIT